jgi:hypothetical protein
MEDIVFNYREIVFYGIKIREDKSKYPWKTDGEADKIFDNLLKRKDKRNAKNEYANLMYIQYDEDMHVKFSLSSLSAFFSICFFTLTILFIANLIIGSVFLVLSFLFLWLHKFYKRKISELYIAKEQVEELVNFIFNNKIN